MASSQVKYSILMLIVGLVLGYFLTNALSPRKEGFESALTTGSNTLGSQLMCNTCGSSIASCGCSPEEKRPVCPPCREPDLSKYVLRSSVPPCPAQPDLSKYMLKTECPPVPDLSNYVLKSSIPRSQPVVLDCSKCSKSKGLCPPCPRPRCPEVKCPEPTVCSPCAPCPRTKCPNPVVKCRAEESSDFGGARPYLAPLDVPGFG